MCFISHASECPAFFDSLGGALGSASSGDSNATLEGCDWEEQPDLNPNGVLLLVFIMHRAWDASGMVLNSTEDMVRQWKEDFEDLLNPTDTPVVGAESVDDEEDSHIVAE